MVVLLSLVALGMMATGGAAIIFGIPIVNAERGWAMVISGTVGASSGAVLLGIALAVQRLGRLVREAVGANERLAQLEELAALRAPEPVAVDSEVIEPGDDKAPAPAPPEIVGRYESAGTAYTMFSDGSIRAETPTGTRRFRSIDELRAYAAEEEATAR